MNRLTKHTTFISFHKTAPVIVALTLLCVLSVACQTTPRDENAKRYELKGKVVSVDKSRQEVEIDHEEIPGLMEAMSMSFSLKEPDALEVMSAGDRIQATLVVTDGRYWLENPVVTKAPAKDANSSALNTLEPQTGTEVPDFSLINQDGKSIRLQQYRDRALVLTFIYTRCPLPDYCTLMSTNFAEINRTLQKDMALGAKTHLLSVSIDPERDTPKVLKSYGAAHTENYNAERFERWEFATGKPAEIKRMAQFFGLSYNAEKDEIVHSLRTAIIAPGGRLHKIYRGNEWKPSEVVAELRKLADGNGDAQSQ
ncbi:MAG TPA: SCO family protein [Pyrinomonadaceae bacterium]|jgi:protein SCO1/2